MKAALFFVTPADSEDLDACTFERLLFTCNAFGPREDINK